MFSLYLITHAAAPDAILRALDAALTPNVGERVCVQLRAKHCDTRDQYALAVRARALCVARGVQLVINDRIDIALSVGADGVHLPERGLPPSAARRLLGTSALIGVSCHDRAGLVSAAEAGASFVTLSPVFDSPDKGAPLGVAKFAEWAATVRLPVYALGGIQPEHAAALRASGASGLAAISAICGAPAPGAAVRRFLGAWDDAPAPVTDIPGPMPLRRSADD